MLVTEGGRKKALADLYRKSKSENDPSSVPPEHQRMMDASTYLAAQLHEVPVLVLPCIEGRTENMPFLRQAVTWGSILSATWSFMLAARARGFGTAWTSLHLAYEREAAAVLGIPYEQVTQGHSSLSPTPSAPSSSPARGHPENSASTGIIGGCPGLRRTWEWRSLTRSLPGGRPRVNDLEHPKERDRREQHLPEEASLCPE